jgi:hypothetical protein
MKHGLIVRVSSIRVDPWLIPPMSFGIARQLGIFSKVELVIFTNRR